MYVVIAGAGLFGLTLAERLIANKHDVMIIDPDAAICEYAQIELGAMAHVGSATSTKVLEAVGIKRADISVAMMRNDAENLAFTLLARSYGVARRLVRMREPDFEEPYRLAGATAIASSVTPVVEQLLVNIEYPEIQALMRLKPGAGSLASAATPDNGRSAIDIFEVAIPVDAFIAGMTVETIARLLEFPQTCNFVAVEPPDGGIEIARGTTEVPGGSNVIMLAMDVELAQVIRLLTRRATSPSAG